MRGRRRKGKGGRGRRGSIAGGDGLLGGLLRDVVDVVDGASVGAGTCVWQVVG